MHHRKGGLILQKLTLVVAALVAALALPPAAAGCESAQVMPYVLVPLETEAGTYYLYYDGGCDPGCHGPEFIVFQETNGVPGLQYNSFFGHAGERCAGETEDTYLL